MSGRIARCDFCGRWRLPTAPWYSACRPLRRRHTSDVPRNETLIVENPEGTIKNAGWFNIWAVNAGGQSTGLHQLTMDTFWFIDPDHGLNGVWDNSLASEPPIYNADFTEMTVKLRPGIFWSDGVEFTADDVVFTIDTHLKTNGPRPERADPAQRRQRLRPRQEHCRLQAEEAELAVPCALHGALERDVDHAEARLRGQRSAEVRQQSAGRRSGRTRSTATIRTASGSPGRSATTGSARRSPASASRAQDTSPISTPARRTSASSRSSTTSSTSSTTPRPKASSRWSRTRRPRRAGSTASPTAIPTRRCRR